MCSTLAQGRVESRRVSRFNFDGDSADELTNRLSMSTTCQNQTEDKGNKPHFLKNGQVW
jgi:hypothetical protein